MRTFDPFAVLGLPRRYDLTAEQVERAYLQRVAALHPDLMAAEALAELGGDGLEAERESSELNDARRILADPEQRAIALWRLLGGIEDKSLAPAFLMEMMAIREDMQASSSDRAKWDAWTSRRREDHQHKVAALFAAIHAGQPAGPLLKQIRLELNAWRYIERMAEQIA
jgi:curved DNA-binding protein CbpA